ncbi:MAG: CDP-alcohol phosphatidyltransferase family protein [Lachnospiraceae bacterium]|nr:CDP-alcohol phosphatidyltransferase family protein [Lachnospiraceae bacterium]
MKKVLDQMRKSVYFNIPNLLGYLRILLIPIFLVLYTRADSTKEYGIAFFTLALSYFSDFIDGKIARKFDMISDFGKALDPVADKLTQASLAIAITYRYPAMLYFLILFVIKELYMAVMGLLLIHRGKGVKGAQSYGKICTAVNDAGCFVLLLFPNIPYFVGSALIVLMMIITTVSWIKYIKFHVSLWKEGEVHEE